MNPTRLWIKRLLIIAGAVVLSIGTALVMRSLDGPSQDQLAEYVAPSGQTSQATVQMFEAASVHMQQGDYQSAIRTYESHLERLNEIPPDQMSSYFGDLGMAHLFQGQTLEAQGHMEQARDHFTRAAFMFEQAAATATYGVIETVATYYQLVALFGAEEYARARTAGEAFLQQQPEAAVEAELLPRGVQGTVKEILAVSYLTLADREAANQERVATLRENGLRYAQEAIAEAPDRVIQPYFYTGVDAAERGETQTAVERLQWYLSLMERIPQTDWDPDDVASVEQARSILRSLNSPMP